MIILLRNLITKIYTLEHKPQESYLIFFMYTTDINYLKKNH